MKLKALLHNTGIECPPEWEEIEITGISYDSRKIKKGIMFVCLIGENTDGHIYAVDAMLRGASAIISEKDLELPSVAVLKVADTREALSAISANFYGNPADKLNLFGITGTNGKTTVTYMLKSCIESQGIPCGLIGTISYKIGEKEYEATRTTPESLDLQAIFNEMLNQNIEYCVMEVSSHALQLGRVERITFDYSIFNNLTQEHLDFHKDIEEYYQAKKRLFMKTEKAAIINVDDKYGERLLIELTNEVGIDIVSCSLRNEDADYYGEVVEKNEKISKLNVYKNNKLLGMLLINTPGVFSLYNALVTAACLHTAGIDFTSIEKGLAELKGVPGRFELVENIKDIPIIVDYAHTPDALKNILLTAKDIVKGRLICVFGCGGDRDRSKRPLMGKVAGELSDYCIITSDNPRTESQKQISLDIEEGLKQTDCKYEVIEDRRKAINRALSIYEKGDLIVIAGKGHENYQIIGGAKTYFSDKETVLELIETEHGRI
ncbi:MAG: UDP-N-acetylmuramoyl-L-alanyl-D-glutamate--2,6-diaminopimelate ligase [Clostridiales bacterium]|nr:UDP-N-acetylmuramoyl-L-alanyl-D-glutamate--2,6-diaminopimelate ligase [Clostridiales bacterium]